MLTAIAKKEFLQLSRDGRFRVMGILVLALLLASLTTGARHFRALQQERERSARVQREQWLTQGEKGPHAAAHFGVYVYKPTGTLALLDRGVDAYAGSTVWLEAHKQNAFRYAPAQDRTSLLRFGELTTAFILQTVLPLLLISLTFGTFAGERERGTLRLAAAQGVSMGTLTLGKAMGVAGAMALLLVPASVCGSAALTLSGATATTMDDVSVRTALLAAAYLLYFGITLTVSLAVSAWAATARLSLLLLLGGWVMGTLIAPRLAAELARQQYPTPSGFAFAKQLEFDLAGGIDAHNDADHRLEHLKKETLQKYGVKRIEDLPVGFDGIRLQAGEDWGYRIFDRAYGNLDAQFTRQERMCANVGYVVPLLSVRGLSEGLAGTDREAHAHFAHAAESYRRDFIRVINDDITKNARNDDSEYKNGRDLYERIPAFVYTPRTMRELWNIHGGAFLSLAVAFVLCASVAVIAARNQKVLR